MNWEQIAGNWKQAQGSIQQQWGRLTNDDLQVIDGKRVELVGRLQARYGYAKEKAEEQVEQYCSTCGSGGSRED